MRKVKKFCGGILAVMVMAYMIAVPVMADENNPDSAVHALSETAGDALYEDPAEGAEDQEESEIPDDVPDVATQEDTQPELSESENADAPVAEDPEQEEAEASDEALSEDVDQDTAEEPEDEYGIAVLAVTNGFDKGADGSWYYYVNGQIASDTNSVIQDKDRKIDGTASWWYVVGGKVQTSFTGLADYPNANGWWYIEKGKVTFTKETVAQNKNGWFYVKDSKVQFGYNGFANNSSGWWYIENGKVTFNKNSVIQDTNKKIDGKSTWWYVVGSKVQTSFTGLADYSNSNGWWYIENGKVTFTKETVAQNKNGWFYVKDSKVQFGYNGFANNSSGWWYIENGKVTFNKNSVIQDTNKKIDGKSTWWYVVGSKVQTSFTGLADYANSNGWWYIENGKVTFSKETVAKNRNGWFYVKDSKVQFGYNGFADNSNGWWYIENGKVTFNKNSVIKDTGKKINGSADWWYVIGSKVQTGFTGLADYSNSNGWWYIENGKVNFDYTGVGTNKNGVWYIKNGKVDFSYNGKFMIGKTTYSVENGKIIFPVYKSTQVISGSELNILTADKGLSLDRTLTQSEFDQIIDRYMNSSLVKNTSYASTNDDFIWNGGTRWDCSSASLYLMNYYLLTYEEAYQAAAAADPSAGTAAWISAALDSLGEKAADSYDDTGKVSSTAYSVSQALLWGNPVYTYKNVGQISANNPGNLRYGDLLFYGSVSGDTVTIIHVAVYLGQYYLSDGDAGYYQMENDDVSYGNSKAGRSSGVRISPLRTSGLVHVARIF